MTANNNDDVVVDNNLDQLSHASTSIYSQSNTNISKNFDPNKKAKEINKILSEENIDLWKLRELAISEGGLINDTIRKRAWPKLVGINGIKDTNLNVAAATSSSSSSSTTTTTTTTTPSKTPKVSNTIRQGINNNTKTKKNELPPRPGAGVAAVTTSTSGVGRNRTFSFDDDSVSNDKKDDNNVEDNNNSDINNNAPPLPLPPSSKSSSSNNNDNSSTNINNNNKTKKQKQNSSIKCYDHEQIERDVTRCTWHLLTGSQRSRKIQMYNKSKNKKVASLLKKKQKRLGSLINLTLLKSYIITSENDDYDDEIIMLEELSNQKNSPERIIKMIHDDNRLRYYQGYHDVASIFLSTLGGATTGNIVTTTANGAILSSNVDVNDIIRSTSNISNINSTDSDKNDNTIKLTLDTIGYNTGLDLPSTVLKQISFTHLKDAMSVNFHNLQKTLNLVVFPLIGAFDSELYNFLISVDMEPYFCISWIITWFSHDIRDTTLIKRLFDVFIISHPLFPVYLSIAMILHPVNRSEILNCVDDFEGFPDFASVHQVLSHLPKNSSAVGWKYVIGEGWEDDFTNNGQHHSTGGGGSVFSGTGGINNSIIADDITTGSLQTDTFLNNTLDISFDGDNMNTNNNTSKFGGMNNANAKDNDNNSMANVTATDNDSVSFISTSNLLSGGIGSNARVPFQELISTALEYMRRIPPRNLPNLSYKYYKETNPDLLKSCSSIALLQPYPTSLWSIKLTTKSDWYIKQYQRKLLGQHKTTRNDRRNRYNTIGIDGGSSRRRRSSRSRSRSRTRSNSIDIDSNNSIASNSSSINSLKKRKTNTNEKDDEKSMLSTTSTDTGSGQIDKAKSINNTPKNCTNNETNIKTYLQEHKNDLAVIAVGYGPSDEEDRRLKRKQRRKKKIIFYGSVVAVAIISISIGIAMQKYPQYFSTGTSTTTTTTPDNDSSSSSIMNNRKQQQRNLKTKTTSSSSSSSSSSSNRGEAASKVKTTNNNSNKQPADRKVSPSSTITSKLGRQQPRAATKPMDDVKSSSKSREASMGNIVTSSIGSLMSPPTESTWLSSSSSNLPPSSGKVATKKTPSSSSALPSKMTAHNEQTTTQGAKQKTKTTIPATVKTSGGAESCRADDTKTLTKQNPFKDLLPTLQYRLNSTINISSSLLKRKAGNAIKNLKGTVTKPHYNKLLKDAVLRTNNLVTKGAAGQLLVKQKLGGIIQNVTSMGRHTYNEIVHSSSAVVKRTLEEVVRGVTAANDVVRTYVIDELKNSTIAHEEGETYFVGV